MNEKLQKIKLVITDVDGVLTDGLLHYDVNGEAIKSFHVRDGLGIRMLMEHGIQVAVLSGRSSPILQKRMQDLGIKLAILGKLEKESACFELMKQTLPPNKPLISGMTVSIYPLLPFAVFHLQLQMRQDMCRIVLIMCFPSEVAKELCGKCPI